MSLDLKTIDRLFDRLQATYGRDFHAKWDGIDPAAVKTLWAHELSVFNGRLQAIAWALENLPARAPNAIEFKILCKQAPAPEVPKLPEPKADPARLAAELAKLAPLKAEFDKPKIDGKEWARRILMRKSQGEKINMTCLRFAKEALGASMMAKIEADRAMAAPMPESIRQKLNELRTA